MNVITKPGFFSWSYSTLKNFETCPRRYYHYNVAKDVIEPQSDELTSGFSLHKAFEARIKDGTPLPVGYAQYEPMLDAFVDAPGDTYAEQKLALTSEFKPIPFFGGPSVWFRTIIDAAKINGDTALVIDWKTGKPKEDTTQLQLISATMMLHDPRLQRVTAALAFITNNHWEREVFTRESIPEIWGEVLPRVEKVKQARQNGDYPPKPGPLCRRWCAVTTCEYRGR